MVLRMNVVEGSKRVPLEGKIFGRLTVLRYEGTGAYGIPLYFCQCECGGTKGDVRSGDLTRGNVKSCGCLKREYAKNLNDIRWKKKGGKDGKKTD